MIILKRMICANDKWQTVIENHKKNSCRTISDGLDIEEGNDSKIKPGCDVEKDATSSSVSVIPANHISCYSMAAAGVESSSKVSKSAVQMLFRIQMLRPQSNFVDLFVKERKLAIKSEGGAEVGILGCLEFGRVLTMIRLRGT